MYSGIIPASPDARLRARYRWIARPRSVPRSAISETERAGTIRLPPQLSRGLFKVGPGFSVFVVQSDLGNFKQVDALPRQAVAFFVFNAQVPVSGLRASGE